MIQYQLLILLALVPLYYSQRSFAEFEIRKRHTSNNQSIPVGKLTLHFIPPHNTVEPEITTYIDQLINQNDFTGNHQAILEFACIETDIKDYNERVYMTSVDQITEVPHGQKIAIILGPHQQRPSINAINYVQTRDKVGETYAEIVTTRTKEDEIFKYTFAPKKNEVEDQSFWGKYKWPLIIGGVIVYTMMTANPAAAQGAAGGAGGAR